MIWSQFVNLMDFQTGFRYAQFMIFLLLSFWTQNASVGRSLARSPNRSFASSLSRLLAWSLARSFARSLARSSPHPMARSLVHSHDRAKVVKGDANWGGWCLVEFAQNFVECQFANKEALQTVWKDHYTSCPRLDPVDPIGSSEWGQQEGLGGRRPSMKQK